MHMSYPKYQCPC